MAFFHSIKKFFQERFNLDEDQADEALIVETIKRDVNLKGLIYGQLSSPFLLHQLDWM
jgi:hypothetical protein